MTILSALGFVLFGMIAGMAVLVRVWAAMLSKPANCAKLLRDIAKRMASGEHECDFADCPIHSIDAVCPVCADSCCPACRREVVDDFERDFAPDQETETRT